ncbi:MAG TPA: hypothetical protein P5230_04310 [Candidatus Magasanikbacteria bacterium]|nr:hypothetical protein [Candidatus Magasanikbacteria bacterium]
MTNANVFFYENGGFVPYNRVIHSEKVSKFLGYFVLGEKRKLFIAGPNLEHNYLMQEAEKYFLNLVSPPFLCGQAYNGCILDDKDVCFSHQSDNYQFQNKLEKNPKVVVEIFGLKDVTSPNSIES